MTLMYNFLFIYKDGVEMSQLSFQDGASPICEQLMFFHDNMMFLMLIILVFVGWMMFVSMINSYYYKYLLHGAIIEMIWTLMPAFVMLFVAFPSLQLLYLMDEIVSPSLTIKAIGHQWYWSYEYSDMNEETIEFDSYMMPFSDLDMGELSLLEVDNSVILPVNTQVSIVITAADVIHCFTIPSLGVKIDAVPGSLNQVGFLMKSPGVYYGQCSEICGSDHSFMPIVVEGVSQEKFVSWMIMQQNEM